VNVDATLLARWQFASVTIYHFMIVPLSIGLTLLVAVMHTLSYRQRDNANGDTWDRASRFWGRVMLVLFARLSRSSWNLRWRSPA